jgi:hypothetical protein
METILKQAAHAHQQAAKEGRSIVYPNQKRAADKAIQYLLMDGTPFVNLIAQPGVGKTGTFLEIAIQATTHPDPTRRIAVDDLFIITGMSDTDWYRQTSQRMLPAFRHRVFHRNHLIHEATRYNASDRPATAPKLIIIDESHIAAKPGMTINTFLTALAGCKPDSPIHPTSLFRSNMAILAVSATPGAILKIPLTKWKKIHHRVVTIRPSDAYHGVAHMLTHKRLFKTGNLEDPTYLKQVIRILHSFREHRFHIFRQTTGCCELYPLFTQLTKTHLIGWNVIRHDATSRVSRMDHMLTTQPAQPTIIIIKGFWRASKRLTQDWIGLTYDPPVTRVNVSAVIQGLIGRFCDNSRPRWIHNHKIQQPVHLVPAGAVRTYLKWIHSSFTHDDGGIRKTYLATTLI